uniref:Variant surface glycoprotein 1720 n=1 Tax=Trypanosoma brucei TaxID=5691 RepID=M4SW43_9TRYP|nr:variant surface glycoprotein 1720 [Trypanosoma brucei]
MTVHVATFYITAVLFYATTRGTIANDTELAKQASACSSAIYLHSLQKSFTGQSTALISELNRLFETQNILTLAASAGNNKQRYGANALAAVAGKQIATLAAKSQTCTAKANEVIALLSMQAGQHLAYDALSKLATPTAEGTAVTAGGGAETQAVEVTLTGLADTTCVEKRAADLTANELTVNLEGLHSIKTYKLRQNTANANAEKKFCATKCATTCNTATNWKPAALGKSILETTSDANIEVKAAGKSNPNELPKNTEGKTELTQHKHDLEWRVHDFLKNKYCAFSKLDLGATATSRSDETIRRVMLAATQGA